MSPPTSSTHRPDVVSVAGGFKHADVDELFANRHPESDRDNLGPKPLPEEVSGPSSIPFVRPRSVSFASVSTLTSLEDGDEESTPIASAGEKTPHPGDSKFEFVVLNGQNGFEDVNIDVLFANRPLEPDHDDLDPGSLPEVSDPSSIPFTRPRSSSFSSVSTLTSSEDSDEECTPIASAGEKRSRPDSVKTNAAMQVDDADPGEPAEKVLPPLVDFTCAEIKGRKVEDVLRQIRERLKPVYPKKNRDKGKARSKRRNHDRHLKALEKYIVENNVLPVFPPYRQKHIDRAVKDSVKVSSDLADFTTSGDGAWQGAKVAAKGDNQTTLQRLKAANFRHIIIKRGKTTIVADNQNRIIGTASAPGDSEEWDETLSGCDKATQATIGSLDMGAMPQGECRGDYSLYTTGLGAGGGRQMPLPLAPKVSVETYEKVSDLYRNRHIQELVGFSTTMFKTFGHRTHNHYASNVEAVYRHREKLGLNPARLPCGFPFATSTFNFGPRTVTKPHFDSKNLGYGWCNIIVLGEFDHMSSGLIVLHTLKLVISAPPGTCLFIPSALIEHYNLGLQDHERRYSLTFYTAADLFRYVDNGFATDTQVKGKKYSTKKRRLEWEKLVKEGGDLRRAEGKARFTKLNEITNIEL